MSKWWKRMCRMSKLIFLCAWRATFSHVSKLFFFPFDCLYHFGCKWLIPLLGKPSVKRANVSTLRLTHRNQTCDCSTAWPPCSHRNMSFGCFLRGVRFARLVSLFVVWVYVGWWWGVAHSSLTWQEPCCFWARVKCSKYAHWGGP